MKILRTLALAILLIARGALAQGFINRNFESANLTGYPQGSLLPATNAFPGWTVNAQYILYDNVSLSGESISILGTNPPNSFPPIQGAYCAFFAPGGSGSSLQPISLGQTGTIPAGTQSITFWGDIGGLQVSFAGQSLTFVQTGSTANYNIYGADISAFAGQTGQLLFTVAPFTGSATLDNILFSPQAIPEPSTFALIGLGMVLLCRRLLKPLR